MIISFGSAPHLCHDLVQERIQTLYWEAEQERLGTRLRKLWKAQRSAERTSRRLSAAVARM